MAIVGGVRLLVCGGMGFVAGLGGNVLTQSISSYNATGSVNISFGDAVFAGVTNSLVCMATMGSMNMWMSDSFNTTLAGKTFEGVLLNLCHLTQQILPHLFILKLYMNCLMVSYL